MDADAGFELSLRGRRLIYQSVRQRRDQARQYEFYWQTAPAPATLESPPLEEAAVLCLGEDGRPTYYELFSPVSSFRSAHFAPGCIEITLSDGSQRLLPCDAPIDFVFQSNLILQVALALKMAPVVSGSSCKYFGPEVLRIGELTCHRTASGWSTNLGFGIDVDADGWPTDIYRQDEAMRGRTLRGAPAAPVWPAGMPEAARLQSPAAPSLMSGGTVDDIALDGRHGPLRAALWRPIVPVRAACLFLQGSGTIDRFGRAGGADLGTSGLFDALTQAGFAVLSMDARGAGATPFAPAEVNTYDARLDDAQCACDWLAGRFGADVPMVLVGHSLGSLIAMMLMSRHSATPRAAVLLAPAGRPLWRLVIRQILQQARRTQNALSKPARLRLRQALSGYLGPASANNGAEAEAPWGMGALLRSKLGRVDPRHLLRGQSCPVLVCFGDADKQVPLQSEGRALLGAFEKAALHAELYRFPQLDHLMRTGTLFDAAAAQAVTQWIAKAIICSSSEDTA